MVDLQDRLSEFLAVKDQFQLGNLPTESPHPKSVGLAEFAKDNLPLALNILQEIDSDAIHAMAGQIGHVKRLAKEINATFNSGGKVIFCGCGATGRLSLLIEALWRNETRDHPWHDRVFSFMAGGDYAFVKSIENFEDFPEYGERQLRDQGFNENDLLIASTEGGETPFVIGATLAAARISRRQPYFLYCNPDDILSREIARSAEVLQHSEIKKINLHVGPMALSGSTRMQASTVLTWAAGGALFESLDNFSLESETDFLISYLDDPSLYLKLQNLIVWEADLYKRGHYVTYESRSLAASVITDLTERAPTFSLTGLENSLNLATPLALAYPIIPGTKNPLQAWTQLLGRPPRSLNWANFEENYGLSHTIGFDFTVNSKGERKRRAPNSLHESISVEFYGNGIEFKSTLDKIQFPIEHCSRLTLNIITKLLLNSISTLVMGRLDRYRSNVMVWVRPSNNKLVDRATRYILNLLHQDGIKPPSYNVVVAALFEVMENLGPAESAVVKTIEKLKSSAKTL